MATHGRTNVKLVTRILSKTLLDKMAVTRLEPSEPSASD